MVLCLVVEGADDSSALLRDLDGLSVWESNWDMKFNTSGCRVVQVTGSWKPINATYPKVLKYWDT